MAGCYGNSKEDRYFESKLNEYLDKQVDYMNTDIEITIEEAKAFLSVVGNMPSSFDKIDDEILANLFDEEKDYDNIMKLWDRLHTLVQEEDL